MIKYVLMRTVFSSLHLAIPLFEGPLDVLVHLIHRREIRSKQVCLKDLFFHLASQLIDFELSAHFLEQFTLLMLFKSRDLLPKEEDHSTLDLAPPQEALFHLSEYYQFKEMAHALDTRQEEALYRFPRGSMDEMPLPPPGLEQISIDQLKSLFQKAMERLPIHHNITKDPYTVKDGKELLLNALQVQPTLDLFSFLTTLESRPLLIVTFLALLELMKEGTVFVTPEMQLTKLRGDTL